jgi:hypothetical protein
MSMLVFVLTPLPYLSLLSLLSFSLSLSPFSLSPLSQALLEVALGDVDSGLGSLLDEAVWRLVGRQDTLGKHAMQYFLKR